MTEIDTLLLMFFLEALLVCGVLLFTLITLSVIKKRRDRAAARDLATRVKDGSEVRIAETNALLQREFSLSDESASGVAEEIAAQERRFYQTLISLYLNREAETVRTLDTSLHALVAPYRDLQLPKEEGASGDSIVQDSAAEELAELRQENEKLKTELGVTMDTMGRMLNEYSSMYNEGAATPPDNEDAGKASIGDDASTTAIAEADGKDLADQLPGFDELDDDYPDSEGGAGEAGMTPPEVASGQSADEQLADILDEVDDTLDTAASDPDRGETASVEAGSPILDDLGDGLDIISDEAPSQVAESIEDSVAAELKDELVPLDDDLDVVFDLPSGDSSEPEKENGKQAVGKD